MVLSNFAIMIADAYFSYADYKHFINKQQDKSFFLLSLRLDSNLHIYLDTDESILRAELLIKRR